MVPCSRLRWRKPEKALLRVEFRSEPQFSMQVVDWLGRVTIAGYRMEILHCTEKPTRSVMLGANAATAI